MDVKQLLNASAISCWFIS